MAESRTRPLKVGLVVIPFEGTTARAYRWTNLLALARRAEAVGFDSVWVPDHLLFRRPGEEPEGAWEAWSLLAALAAATTRVELGPFVLCTAWRNPALIAKLADTVDEISGGRLVLALGAGWHQPEFDAFGFPFDHRYARFAEALEIINGLLRTGHVDFAGTYHQARDCELRPRGPRPEGPPIMIGTTGEKMLRLTARYADWWNIDWRNRPEEIPPYRASVDAACADVGRDAATLVRTAGIMVDLPRYPARDNPASPPLAGTHEEIAEGLRAHAREGIASAGPWPSSATSARPRAGRDRPRDDLAQRGRGGGRRGVRAGVGVARPSLNPASRERRRGRARSDASRGIAGGRSAGVGRRRRVGYGRRRGGLADHLARGGATGGDGRQVAEVGGDDVR